MPPKHTAARLAFALLAVAVLPAVALAQTTILNVSYDVSRELYKDINSAFIAGWKAKSGETVAVNQSHGGSSKQALSVAAGLDADVVTMNQALDVDILVERGGYIAADWRKRFPHGATPLVYPSLSIEAAPPVAVVEKVVDKKGTRKVATAYLEFLFSPQGQEIIAKHAFRPRDAKALQKFSGRFPAIKTFTVEEALGGWAEVQAKHFAEGPSTTRSS